MLAPLFNPHIHISTFQKTWSFSPWTYIPAYFLFFFCSTASAWHLKNHCSSHKRTCLKCAKGYTRNCVTASSLTYKNRSKFTVVCSCAGQWISFFLFFLVTMEEDLHLMVISLERIRHSFAPGQETDSRCQKSANLRMVSFTSSTDDINCWLSKGKTKESSFCTFLCPKLLQLVKSFTHVPNYVVLSGPFFHKYAVCDTQHATWRICILYSRPHPVCGAKIWSKGKLLNECTVKMKKLLISFFFFFIWPQNWKV